MITVCPDGKEQDVSPPFLFKPEKPSETSWPFVFSSSSSQDMYSRWQPGLGFAVSFVLLVATLVQYGAQHVNYHSEISKIRKWVKFAAFTFPLHLHERVKKTILRWWLVAQSLERFQVAARQAAHKKVEKSSAGKSQGRKKVKISLSKGVSNDQEGNGGESDIPVPKSRQERRRMQQATGSKIEKPSQPGWIDMVVEGDDVWIVAEDGTGMCPDKIEKERENGWPVSFGLH